MYTRESYAHSSPKNLILLYYFSVWYFLKAFLAPTNHMLTCAASQREWSSDHYTHIDTYMFLFTSIFPHRTDSLTCEDGRILRYSFFSRVMWQFVWNLTLHLSHMWKEKKISVYSIRRKEEENAKGMGERKWNGNKKGKRKTQARIIETTIRKIVKRW